MEQNIKELANDYSNLSVTVTIGDLRELFAEWAGNISVTPANTAKNENSDLVTIDWVCDYLQVSKPTLHRWNKLGYLTNVHVGRMVRYRREDVVRFAAKDEVQ